jgi:DnaA family protein
MSQQLPLALGMQQAPSLDDFVVGRNQAVIDALGRALDGRGESMLYLFGPVGCGRTHLLLGQCAAAERRGLRCAYLPLGERVGLSPAMLEDLEALDLVAIDDVQQIAADIPWEQGLFALFNRCRDLGTQMLFSADRGPATLPLQLADLRSRLAWGLTLSVHPLDDAGRLELLQSLAVRRALQLPDEVARYLLDRSARHPKDLEDVVDRLDRASLAEGRRLTIPFVREVLRLG